MSLDLCLRDRPSLPDNTPAWKSREELPHEEDGTGTKCRDQEGRGFMSIVGCLMTLAHGHGPHAPLSDQVKSRIPISPPR